MAELLAPTVRLHRAWCSAHEEWGPGLHEDGFGLLADDVVVTRDGFARWVARLSADVDTTYRWLVEDDEVLGGIALRHRLESHALDAGQLGYGVRPTARGRGLATRAVAEMLELAGALGLDRLLVVCAADNIASARVVEHHGGRLEGIRDTALGPARRYWMPVTGP